jgi:hypothetical protein
LKIEGVRYHPNILLLERYPNHLDSEVDSEEVIAVSEEAAPATATDRT